MSPRPDSPFLLSTVLSMLSSALGFVSARGVPQSDVVGEYLLLLLPSRLNNLIHNRDHILISSMVCTTMIRVGCLVACAAVASGLHADTGTLTQLRGSNHSVLILGCSVDRNAVESFCGKVDRFYRVGCYDEERQLNIGFVFHPGVGINGDLQPPFYNRTQWGSNIGQPISDDKVLRKWSSSMVGELFPDMVVVDSSLWDLSTWASWGMRNVTADRLRQWGMRDLKNELARVSEAYNKSRIVFRTAPAVYKTKWVVSDTGYEYKDVAVFSNDGIRQMQKELRKHIKDGKLYGKYEVIDYSQIMDDLIQERGADDPSLWLKDGYHPKTESAEPSRRYLNEVFRLMGLATVEKMVEVDTSQRRWAPAAGDRDEAGNLP
ncbi:unnamed protein product [Prorocentrum cordatum]|uniref:SGNH/GDSL hydrolase family protein n=1 Tax=Prorocentrum cordatum TaxID=2364126 RepID=A0ABN9TQI8_9DINO|nr:unnamed protein product [Polarella glacialis]